MYAHFIHAIILNTYNSKKVQNYKKFQKVVSVNHQLKVFRSLVIWRKFLKELSLIARVLIKLFSILIRSLGLLKSLYLLGQLLQVFLSLAMWFKSRNMLFTVAIISKSFNLTKIRIYFLIQDLNLKALIFIIIQT